MCAFVYFVFVCTLFVAIPRVCYARKRAYATCARRYRYAGSLGFARYIARGIAA